jgi:sugar phosphate isomerase/epimerase
MSEPLSLAGRLGCTTLTFGCLLPEKLRVMKEAGFVATEFFARDLFEDLGGPQKAVAALRESGLAISAYQALRDYEGMPSAQRDQALGVAEQMMDQMGWLGADTLVLAASVDPQASPDRVRCGEDLLRLAELARTRHIRIAYEPIGWASCFSDYRDAWSLVQEVNHPQLGVLLDVLHVSSRGQSMEAIDSFDAGKIFLAQLCDWPQTKLSPFEIARHYRLFPGEGVARVTEFVRRLEGIGYRGLYSVEIMNDRYFHDDPATVARRGMEATLRLAREETPCT